MYTPTNDQKARSNTQTKQYATLHPQTDRRTEQDRTDQDRHANLTLCGVHNPMSNCRGAAAWAGTGQDSTGQDKTRQDRTGARHERSAEVHRPTNSCQSSRRVGSQTEQDRTGQDRTGQTRQLNSTLCGAQSHEQLPRSRCTGWDTTGQDGTGQDRKGTP